MSDDELEQQVFDILKKEGALTQEQAEEFLAVLFDIMQMMLDAGMDLESIQKFLDANQIRYDLEDEIFSIERVAMKRLSLFDQALSPPLIPALEIYFYKTNHFP